MTIITRPATLTDMSLLVDLMQDFYREADYALDRAWAAAAFSALLNDSRQGGAWLAMEGELPVGYIVLTVRFSMEFGGLDGFVDDLFVRPPYRRRGIASDLLDTVAAEGERRGLLALHVETAANSPAAMLYQKLGWRDCQRVLLTRQLA